MKDWRIRVVPADGGEALTAHIDQSWAVAAHKAGFVLRTANVGAPVYVEVAVLSVAEALRVNEAFIKHIDELVLAQEDEPDRRNPLRVLDERSLSAARSLAAMLEAVGRGGYFTSWVIVECADID